MKKNSTEHTLSQPPLGQGRPRLERIQTTLGFDLLLDPGDFLSRLLIRDGVFEAPETDLVSRLLRRGDICIDAGCHMGYYTCLMTRLAGPAGHVYAFDANPNSCEATQRNLNLNSLRGAEVIHAALGDRQGRLHLARGRTEVKNMGHISDSD